MSRGSARPVGEGGYYIHFATMNDFLKHMHLYYQKEMAYIMLKVQIQLKNTVRAYFA